jgi:hypothetical protein
MVGGRHDERQGTDQMRQNARQRAPLADEQPHLREVERLQRAQSAVQRLEVVEGGGRAEIAFVDDGDRQPALRGVPRRGDAVEAGADDNHVEFRVRQTAEVALHRPLIVRYGHRSRRSHRRRPS